MAKQSLILSAESKGEMHTRMRRIEGQARGLQRMLAEDRDCLELLTQLASLRSAAYGASVALTEQIAVQCVRDGGRDESADEAVRNLVQVLLRAPH